MTYSGFVSNYDELEPGMFVEVIAVSHTYTTSYPPPGSIIPVVASPFDRVVLDCTEWGLNRRTGYGLKYKLVTPKRKIRGVAQFLKEKRL